MSQRRRSSWTAPISVLLALLIGFPVAAAELGTATSDESDWDNLQRLSPGAPVLIERTDGTRVKGRLISVADDALSVRKDKAVVGVARLNVGRIWLLGKNKARKGALIGAVAGGAAGALLGAALFRSYESGEKYGVLFGLVLGGVGAGVGAGAGAGVGAGFRKRTLIYQAPPSNPSPPASAQSVRVPCARLSAETDSLAAPLSKFCRVFSAERAARELAAKAEIR